MRGVNFVCQAVSARLARMVGTQLRPCRRFGCRACERMRVSECACVCVCVHLCVCVMGVGYAKKEQTEMG